MSTTIRTSLIPGVPTLEVEMTLNRVAAFLILASVGYYSKNKRIQDACLQLHNEATVLLVAFSGSVSATATTSVLGCTWYPRAQFVPILPPPMTPTRYTGLSVIMSPFFFRHGLSKQPFVRTTGFSSPCRVFQVE